jgi:hypothetical protein
MDSLAVCMIVIGLMVSGRALCIAYKWSCESRLEKKIIALSRIDDSLLDRLPTAVEKIGIACDCFDGYQPKVTTKLLKFVSTNNLEFELGRIVGLLMKNYDLDQDSGKTATLLTATCCHLQKPRGFFLGLYEVNPKLAKWWIDSPIPPRLQQ